MKTEKDISKTVESLANAETKNFVDLAKISGLDPKTDFQYVNLKKADFSDCDLSDFVFKGSVISEAKFHNTIVSDRTFDEDQLLLPKVMRAFGKGQILYRGSSLDYLTEYKAGGRAREQDSTSETSGQSNSSEMNLIFSDWRSFLAACGRGDLRFVASSLALGIDLNQSLSGNEDTPLTLACQNGHLDIAKKLIQHGADVDQSPSPQKTPLLSASRNGHVKLVQLLLDSGASINLSASASGQTPLMIASNAGHLDVVLMLLNCKRCADHTALA